LLIAPNTAELCRCARQVARITIVRTWQIADSQASAAEETFR